MIEVIRIPTFVLVIFGPGTDLDSCSVRPPAERASGCQSKMVPFRSHKNAELIFVPSPLSSQKFFLFGYLCPYSRQTLRQVLRFQVYVSWICQERPWVRSTQTQPEPTRWTGRDAAGAAPENNSQPKTAKISNTKNSNCTDCLGNHSQTSQLQLVASVRQRLMDPMSRKRWIYNCQWALKVPQSWKVKKFWDFPSL